MLIPSPVALILARGIPDHFLQDLWNGDIGSWVTVGAMIATVVGMHIARKYFGWKPPTRKERRAARERSRIVIWKYERD